MKSEESRILIREKRAEGKKDNQIYQELNNLKQSQIQFKELQKELNHLNLEINKKDSKIEELKEELNKSKNKLLVQGLKIEAKPVLNTSKSANLNNCKRIINFTEVGKAYTRSDLAKEFVFTTETVSEILTFLTNHTNTKFEIDSRGRYVRCQ